MKTDGDFMVDLGDEEPYDTEDFQQSSSGSGIPTQYDNTKGGFIPVTSTVARIPPGLYSPEFFGRELGFLPQKVSTDDFIILPDSSATNIINEIKIFWSLKDKFDNLKLAYKRGILLWGPPGNGKTAIVLTVVKNIVEDGGLALTVDNPRYATELLRKFRIIEPSRPIVIIFEDIDQLIKKSGYEKDLLSLLDGDKQISKVVYLATTNYPETLDPNIINRPSRFDKIIHVDVPSKEVRVHYIAHKMKNLTEIQLLKWITETEGFSISHIKELIIAVSVFDYDFDKTIERLKGMKVVPKSSGTKLIGLT